MEKSYGLSKQWLVLQNTTERSDGIIFGGDRIIPYRYDRQEITDRKTFDFLREQRMRENFAYILSESP